MIYSSHFHRPSVFFLFLFFFCFNDTATTEIYTNLNTLSLHDALPICGAHMQHVMRCDAGSPMHRRSEEHTSELQSHSEISYAVFCLKKKKEEKAKGAQRQRVARRGVQLRGAPEGEQDTDQERRRSDLRREGFVFFFNDTATTEISTNLNTLSLPDALPISPVFSKVIAVLITLGVVCNTPVRSEEHTSELQSHSEISYAVFCLKKKKKK